ncbi:hypothetical protein JCM3775_007511 [Rhodotorula graminis]|uniref:OTU domain-containing protein n=1 Tax=Rhodotorula graminis (strain WP1) TaxID=578459 RepID=A0A0P9EXK7_RHOGW|nr:uncharacterized protein RHOBADRAFT_56264 [Rhodotorula graminis WP1]KPV71878.1 hypothetical protein RHOBADRAFT_56264 [Rhodotorula graminis WP1]
MAKGARHDLKGKGKARERSYGKARDRTRGDKPRLIEDPELEERVLSSQLKDAGLYAANILGDGNCLFRALSDQLYGSPSMHQAIRTEICNYLASHPDKYRLFVDEDSVKGGFDGHVREMRQNGTYGTNIELSAFVARYRRPVKVYQPNLVYVLPVEEKGPSTSASSSSPPPPPAPSLAQAGDGDKLTPRERRLKARQDKLGAKGKGKQRDAAAAAASDKVEAASRPAPSAPEPFDDSPLCIVYHSWEHYSSLRNISGPHTGPPRLRVGRVNSPAVNNGGAAASSDARQDDESAERGPARDVDEEEEEEKVDDERDEDTTMDESQDTVAPPRRTPRGSPPTDHPLPAVRTALARARPSADGPAPAESSGVLPQPSIPIFPPSDSSASPSSPPSSSASSPPPPAGSADSTTRPPKHLLDRSLSQPRSYSPLSISSSSSAAPPTTSDHDDAELDVNDNDRAGPRTRSRLASPASGSVRSAASSSSSSGTSTGVASSAAVAEDDEDASESSSRASPAAPAASSSPAPPVPATRGKSRGKVPPPPRERRGPTSSEKKELARVRRLERRRAKGGLGRAGDGDDEGRVLRSGRRTSGAGGQRQVSQQQADAGLGKVRELFI